MLGGWFQGFRHSDSEIMYWQAALVGAGGIQALDLLVESGEPRFAASAAAVLAQIDPKDFATSRGDQPVKAGEAACDTAQTAGE